LTAPHKTDSSLREITGQQWLVLFAAQAGYMLDAMDVLLFIFAVNAIAHDFGLSSAQAGLVSSSTLAFSAIGGIVFGVLSDRIGRARCLIWSILIYSVASAGSATSTGLGTLLVWRALIGIGLGAEWSTGAVLVAETWPAQHRAKAVGIMQSGWALGYMLAAGFSAWILPRWGWKILFLTGLLPAFGALLLRRKLREPEIWQRANRSQAGPERSPRRLFEGALRNRTLLGIALATSVLFAYWGVFTWIPGFLSAPVARGGAGLSIVPTSAFVGAALVTPIYGATRNPQALLLLGPAVGFLGTGFFSLFGAMLAELYPTAVRGAAGGVIYNIGRGLSALAPWTVGWLADRYGIGASLALNSAFFLGGAALIFTLPETKQAELE
jgi:MFS family permease